MAEATVAAGGKRRRFGRRRIALAILLTALAALYLNNASWLAPAPAGEARLLAHRGVHQAYGREGLERDDCTAIRMGPPTHPFLENTIPSMRAAFAAGAGMVEIDIHPTTDGEFAVFHDWTLDCRTEGRGVTRDASMPYLRTLDLGYGYTHDGGRTFPFRGRGVGMMPTLAEVLRAFPDRQFLINIKSRDVNEADLLIAYLRARGLPTDERLMVYGHERPVDRLLSLAPEARGFARSRVKICALRYLALGWSGYLPTACRRGFIAVPVNLRWVVWGWPNRFLQRMRDADVTVIITGPYGSGGTPGLDRVEDLAGVPRDFDGITWTDTIETIGPAWARRVGAAAR
jgi:glycerophosphoryl diester phosphodiesterase